MIEAECQIDNCEEFLNLFINLTGDFGNILKFRNVFGILKLEELVPVDKIYDSLEKSHSRWATS